MLSRDLRAALLRLNPGLPDAAIDDALRQLTAYDVSRSTVQHNRDFHRLLRGGVPVAYRDAAAHRKTARARVIDFANAPGANRFLAVRELVLTGVRTPNYNRRADLVCFVNGLPLVFIELKAVYRNIRAGFDGNLRDYLDENVIAHAFHHNAFLIVANGDHARYGSITSQWEHFHEWKRLDEKDPGRVAAEVLLNGMLAQILAGLPTTDMAPDWERTLGRRGLLAPGRLFICYAEQGGALMLFGDDVPRRYRIVDPRTGAVVREGVRGPAENIVAEEGGAPRVYIFCDEP